MAYTEAQRDALKDRIAEGVLRVTYDGITTEFRSLDEMERLLARMNAELADAAGTARRREIKVRTKKGLS